MDVDTLLTRQMELHTSVRQPPKNPQDLVQLMDVMSNYKHYFKSLRTLADRFAVEPETVFQSFMHISVGGTVNFDRQHQDGAVPMHQAKVLARSNAIELAPTLRKELPNSELMVYVGLSRDLRNTLRVKVEDGNDLKTAEKSVCEAVEYLTYIHQRAQRNPERLYALYMAEDPTSLAALLGDGGSASPMTTSTATLQDTLSTTSPGLQLPGLGESSGAGEAEPAALPSPLSAFLPELKRQCAMASDTAASVSGSATRRLKATQVLLDWVTAVPAEYFAEHAEAITAALATTLAQLAAEKRSALCRVGCDVIVMLLQRLSNEPVFLEDVGRGTCSTNPVTFSGALSLWVASLAKGTYVTIAAISSATDTALRVVAIQSHGHLCVVKTLLTALSGGSQTELRRKCLGYLALCVVAAHEQRPERVRELVQLLGPVAVNYVSIGDSPSRKMARALCSVLRVLTSSSGPAPVLHIKDERTESLVQQERPQVEPAVLGGPQELEELLFEADTFVSSIRSTFSAGSQRNNSAGGSLRGGRGRGGARLSGGQRTFGVSATSSESPLSCTAASRHGGGAGGSAFGEHVVVTRSPLRSQPAAALPAPRSPAMANVKSPSRRAAAPRHVSPTSHGAGNQTKPAGPAAARRGSSPARGPSSTNASPVKGTAGGASRAQPSPSASPVSVMQPGDIYDAEVFLGDAEPTPTGVARRGGGGRRVSAARTSHDSTGSGGGGAAVGGSGHLLLPPITPHVPHRVAPLHGEEDVLVGGTPHRRPILPASGRLVPLSLREHGDAAHVERLMPAPSGGASGGGAGSTPGAAAPKMSKALRRKIEESKSGLGG